MSIRVTTRSAVAVGEDANSGRKFAQIMTQIPKGFYVSYHVFTYNPFGISQNAPLFSINMDSLREC